MRNLTEEKRERRRAQQRKGLLSRAEMAYEKRNSPDAIWDRLLNGRTFDSYEMKTVVI